MIIGFCLGVASTILLKGFLRILAQMWREWIMEIQIRRACSRDRRYDDMIKTEEWYESMAMRLDQKLKRKRWTMR